MRVQTLLMGFHNLTEFKMLTQSQGRSPSGPMEMREEALDVLDWQALVALELWDRGEHRAGEDHTGGHKEDEAVRPALRRKKNVLNIAYILPRADSFNPILQADIVCLINSACTWMKQTWVSAHLSSDFIIALQTVAVGSIHLTYKYKCTI